jgi:hypothetical protein
MLSIGGHRRVIFCGVWTTDRSGKLSDSLFGVAELFS